MSKYSFDAADADFILRSSNPPPSDVPDAPPSEFRVHRCLLAAASLVFRDMLSLPQPHNSNAITSLPVVDLPETPQVLDLLLRFIYPIVEPPIPDLSTLVTVFLPAVKYEAEGIIARLRKILVSPVFLEGDPLRVYSIAARWGFEEEAKIASTHTLSINILASPLHDDLRYMAAYDYHRLLTFHRARSDAAVELVDVEPVIGTICVPQNKFYEDFRKKARGVLAVRPETRVISSLEFITQIMNHPYHNCCGCYIIVELVGNVFNQH